MPRDADDKGVLLRQHRWSKVAGLRVGMSPAHVWTRRGDRQTRTDTYSDPTEAREAVDLAG
jgi:hypothetical protein